MSILPHLPNVFGRIDRRPGEFLINDLRTGDQGNRESWWNGTIRWYARNVFLFFMVQKWE